MSDDLRKTVFGSRDTQFQGFAKLLQHDIWETEVSLVPMLIRSPTGQVAKELAEALQTLIAQRAYDLVEHILKQTPSGSNYIRYFEDMTEWPDHRAFADALADLAKIHEKLTQLPESPTPE